MCLKHVFYVNVFFSFLPTLLRSPTAWKQEKTKLLTSVVESFVHHIAFLSWSQEAVDERHFVPLTQ